MHSTPNTQHDPSMLHLLIGGSYRSYTSTRVHEYNQHISHDVQQQKHGASHANQHTGKSRNQGKRSILELCLDCVKYTLEADYLTTMANQTGVMSKNAGPKIKMNNAHVATATC